MKEKSEKKDGSSLAEDQRVHISAAVFIVAALFYAAGFGISSICFLVASLFGGLVFSKWMFDTTDGYVLESLVTAMLGVQTKTKKSYKNRDLDDEEEKTRKMPWADIELPSSLNDSLVNLLNEIVEQYVNLWYEGAISRDRAFLNEIRYQLRYACANIVHCVKRIDLAHFVTSSALPSATFHLTRIKRLETLIREKENLTNLPRSVVETKMAEALTDMHVALTSREHESDYLRQVAEFLMPRLLDESRLAGRAHDDDSPLRVFSRRKKQRPWPSQSVPNLLRELLTNAVLLPIIDVIAQPDTINHWMTVLFDENRQYHIYDRLDESPVPFLRGFIISSMDNVPDSLLQLKLSEILRDARLYSIFRMYLQDVRGPVHELQFLAETSRIHDAMQRKSESSSQIAYDIWQLYGQFVHESAQELVQLDEELSGLFKSAVEENDLTRLDGIIESSFQAVYQRMQLEHVVLFCQSECFLGHLCGSPPVTINELIDRDAQERRRNVQPEKNFSLSQLRARVRKALTSVSDVDEDVEDVLGGISNNIDADVQSPESQNSSSGSSLVNIPSIDIVSDNDVDGSQESDPIETDERVNEKGGLVLDSDARDLNNWRVHVARVATLRDSNTERTIYVFVIEVERTDAKEHETKRWSVHRSFNEFYVLESKLIEFHGDSLRFSPLPARKTFVTKNRPFMEQHRLIFSTFLSSLCKQRLLNRSELLLTFLSSNEEFRDNLMLSDLNPWKVVKKMPGKLSREKGQNLRPYLLKSMAIILAPVTETTTASMKNDGDTTSVDSSCGAIDSLATNSVYSRVYGNNFGGVVDAETTRQNANDVVETLWTRSVSDSILLMVFTSWRRSTSWLLDLLSAARVLCNRTIDATLHQVMTRVFEGCLCVENLVYLVQHVQYTLFCNDGPWPTEQEMEMREELAKRRTLEYFRNMGSPRFERVIDRDSVKSAISLTLDALQYPRMNKQLLYVLIDQLLVELFPELSEAGTHPLQ